jgi:hypothetical protein
VSLNVWVESGTELTIVGGVFLASDHGLRVEERPVGTGLHVVDNARLEVHIDGARDVFSTSGLRKEGRETVLFAFCSAWLNTAVGLHVNDTLAADTKEHTRTRTLNPCSRV